MDEWIHSYAHCVGILLKVASCLHLTLRSSRPLQTMTRQESEWSFDNIRCQLKKHRLLFSNLWLLCMLVSESLFPDIHEFPAFNMITSEANLVTCLSPCSSPAGLGAPLGVASNADARAEAIALVFPLSAVVCLEICKLRSLIQLATLIHHNLTTGARMQVITWG